jgi:hypothetical protein
MRHWVSEIKHIILFFRNRGTFRKKKKRTSPIRVLGTLCPVSPGPRGLQFKSKMQSEKPEAGTAIPFSLQLPGSGTERRGWLGVGPREEAEMLAFQRSSC